MNPHVDWTKWHVHFLPYLGGHVKQSKYLRFTAHAFSVTKPSMHENYSLQKLVRICMAACKGRSSLPSESIQHQNSTGIQLNSVHSCLATSTSSQTRIVCSSSSQSRDRVKTRSSQAPMPARKSLKGTSGSLIDIHASADFISYTNTPSGKHWMYTTPSLIYATPV